MNRKATGAGLTIVFGLFCIPPILLGLEYLSCSFMIHTTDVYYVEYDYLPSALILCLMGAVSVACTLIGAWRRGWFSALFAIPVMLGLVTMIAAPDSGPRVRTLNDHTYLVNASSHISAWHTTNRRFPTNATEINSAVQGDWRKLQDGTYSRKGTRLPYEIVVNLNATGPKLTDVSTRPGVIYYCVSADAQEFWLTMTALEKDEYFSRAASLKRTVDQQDVWVIHVSRRET